MATIDDIRNYFEDILQRSGDEVSEAEIQSYVSAVDSGALTLAQARAALINSPEGENVQDVVRLYQTFFGRVPDQAGLNFQVDALRNGANIQQVAEGFANSAEFSARFGSNTVTTAFINSVYQQVLGRTPAASEVQFYLDSGFSAGRIALAFSESPEFVSNTETAVEAFLDTAGLQTQDYTGSLGDNAPVNPGELFTLTVGADELTGTANNDTFRVITANALETVDVINGGAGFDVLNISATGIAANAAPVISNIERINNASTTSLDLSAVTGAQQIWSSAGSTYTNAALATVFGAENLAAATTINVDYAGSLAGSTTASVAVNNSDAAGDATFDFGADATAIEAVNVLVVDGNVADVTLDAGLTVLETITVTGAGDAAVVSTATTLTSFNASAATGDLTFTSGALADSYTATGGSGDDVLNFGAVVATDAVGTISGGAGDDVITGGAGDDIINGDAGNDIIVGGAGDDTLNGGDGNDILGGGAGADILTGGAGNDEFHFNTASSDDTVVDFTVGQDVISLKQGTDGLAFNDSTDSGIAGQSDLNAADFNRLATFANVTTAQDQELVVFNTAFADQAAVNAAVNTSGVAAEIFFVVFNEEAGNAQLYYDAGGASTTATLVADITSIDSIEEVRALTAANFDVYA